MKTVVQVKLVTTPEQFAAVAATLAGCNAAANTASSIAHTHGAATAKRKVSFHALQKLAYPTMKQALSAQPSLLVLSKVVGSPWFRVSGDVVLAGHAASRAVA
jgi:hypothetical protein